MEVCDQVMCQRMTNPSGTAPRPVIHLLELLSFQTATFAEFRLARERVGYGDEGPLFHRTLGVPQPRGADTALRAKTAERPLVGTERRTRAAPAPARARTGQE